MTGPCTDIEPSAAKRYSTGLEVWNDRCVSIRWKPTVTPKPVRKYMTPSATRSCQPTTSFHSSVTAAMKAMNGTTTAPRFTILALRDMPWRLCTELPRLYARALSAERRDLSCPHKMRFDLPPSLGTALRPTLPDL